MNNAALNTPTMLTAALYYAGEGFPVFPVRENIKDPATKNGFYDGTVDASKINNWFASGIPYNIGITCGGGLVVIDIDVKNGVDGIATLAALEVKHGKLPPTRTVSTPSKGLHLYFRYPPSVDIGIGTGKINGMDTPGVDYRGQGGFVVAPPSTLLAEADKRGKNVTGEYVTTDKRKIADLPPAWVAFLAKPDKERKPPPETHHQQGFERSEYQQLAEVESALTHLNAGDSYTWEQVMFGMAGTFGMDGYPLFDRWSSTGEGYNEQANRKRYQSCIGMGKTVATVFKMAQDAGWTNPAKRRKPEPPPRTEQHDRAGYQHRDEWRGNRHTDDEQDKVKLVSGLSITPRQVEWAWNGWLPKGKLSLLVGAPKTGKTMLAIELAATITSGGKFPDGTRADKSTVIFWTAEDDLEDTILPRFKAAGGDLANVQFIGDTVSSGRAQPFNPAQDMPLLMDTIHGMDKPPALLILDPVVSVAPDMNNASQVRIALAPVVNMAQTHGMAVLGITHFRKSSAESGSQSERILGSQAWLAVARMVWYAIKPPDMEETRVFYKGDTNLAASDEGFLYEVESRDAEFPERLLTVRTAGIVWGEKVDSEALQAMIKPDSKADTTTVQVEAEEFLKQFLATGTRLKADIDAEADNQGITRIALTRAKKSLGIKHRRRRGDSKYEWYLKTDHVDQPHTHDKHDQVDKHDKQAEQETFVV